MRKIIIILAASAMIAVAFAAQQTALTVVSTSNTLILPASFTGADAVVIEAQIANITNAAGVPLVGTNIYVIPTLRLNFSGTNSIAVFGQ